MRVLRLGRIVRLDQRDRDYPVRSLLQFRSPLKKRRWPDDIWSGNQGTTTECVAYGWVNWLEGGPIYQKPPHPCVDPHELYAACQRLEGETDPEAGTTVRAGAEVLKSMGYIASYHWAFTLRQVAQTLLQLGPMVVGTNWYEQMFYPTKSGFIRPSGDLAGGHAYLLDEVDTVKQFFGLKCAWGLDWGKGGRAYLSFADFSRLLRRQGEACIAAEISRKAKR